MTANRTATLVRKLSGWAGDARLYKLNPPMATESGASTDHVIVSAANVIVSGPETYVFAAGPDGKVTSWSEMRGSFRGALDHGAALRGAGYDVPVQSED
jgi:hypothetical protein